MKKVASIVAMVAFAVGIYVTQTDSALDFNFDIEKMLACGDCDNGGGDGKRGGTT